jgi:putative RNase toxin 17 of polymorphic toxin system
VSERANEGLTAEQQVVLALNLPFRGECPFVPPKRWRANQPLHGSSTGGYFDLKGRLWKKGRSVTPGQHFEWDVQIPGGSHLNVDWTGRITHPRPTAERSPEKRNKRRRKTK